jgi:hypothetical protein
MGTMIKDNKEFLTPKRSDEVKNKIKNAKIQAE